MKVLIVCSANSGKIVPFVTEQADDLIKIGVEISFFTINGKGIWGYLKNIPKYIKTVKKINPDIIHAHFGLSGLLANFIRSKPVVTTFHGCDINKKSNLKYSQISIKLSAHSIFVSDKQIEKAKPKGNYSLIPCGTNPNIFYPIEKLKSREILKLDDHKKIILFASSFSIGVKNYTLAKKAMEILNDNSDEILELSGYSREEVAKLMNACDLVLLTSIREGSPQVIKEAMLCNCPIVSTDVGDVKQLINGIEGCYITSFEPDDVAEKISLALNFAKEKKRNLARNKIFSLGLDSGSIANKIKNVYSDILKES